MFTFHPCDKTKVTSVWLRTTVLWDSSLAYRVLLRGRLHSTHGGVHVCSWSVIYVIGGRVTVSRAAGEWELKDDSMVQCRLVSTGCTSSAFVLLV